MQLPVPWPDMESEDGPGGGACGGEGTASWHTGGSRLGQGGAGICDGGTTFVGEPKKGRDWIEPRLA